MSILKLKELSDFLREANKQTYANASASKASPTRQGSKDYHYESPPFAYHDTYFGGRKFIGNEVIYHNGIAVWGMGYHGEALIEELDERALDKCLRTALMQEDANILPIRGPASYSLESMHYRFAVTGGLDSFKGIEEISQDDRVIYRCDVHGGLILK